MTFIEQLKNEKENLFHFYIILGNLEKNSQAIFDFLKKDLAFSMKIGDNFFHFSEKKLSIDDVRKIKKINSLKKNNPQEIRIFLIESSGIDREAQNALLKTLEEPQGGTIFFLLLENDNFILDTIKSRARILKGFSRENYEKGRIFLESDFLERERLIKKIKKEAKDSSESRIFFLNLLGEIDLVFLEHQKDFVRDKDFMDIYKKFLILKKEAEARGAGISYIMIYLAIILPKIKNDNK